MNVSAIKLLEEMAKDQRGDKSDIECKFFENASDVPDPRDLNPTKKNLMVFDDLLLEKQNKCEAYYTRGRHSNVDCFYLAQNYFKLPRQTIRENANFICLFPQDLKNVNHIYNDHVSSDMSKEDFRYLCKETWKEPFNFVVIHLEGKMRENIGCGWTPFIFQIKYILYIKMERELLERIADNTKPKESFQIVVSNNKTKFTTQFNPHIQLKKNKRYEIALVNLETYHSFPNITHDNNNFSYSPDAGGIWYNIIIPEGSYDIEDIKKFIQQKMKQNGHDVNVTLSANTNTLKAVLILENNYHVDFRPEASICSLLGFNKAVYT